MQAVFKIILLVSVIGIAFFKESASILVLIVGILLFSNKEIVAQTVQDTVEPKTKSPSKQKDSTQHAWVANYAGGPFSARR